MSNLKWEEKYRWFYMEFRETINSNPEMLSGLKQLTAEIEQETIEEPPKEIPGFEGTREALNNL